MKSRWMINLILLLAIVVIAVVVKFNPEKEQKAVNQYEISSHRLADFHKIEVSFPAKAGISFEKKDGYWFLVQPYKARADQMLVSHILSIVAAKSNQKLPLNDLAQFGLDQPKLKLKLDDVEILFGTFNPVTSEQYVSLGDSVYLLPVSYAESASSPAEEYLDKSPLQASERNQISGFDLSHLEQWQDVRLNVDLLNGQWKVSDPKAKPNQKTLSEWYDGYWRNIAAPKVLIYNPDHRVSYPYIEVKLANGKKVHLDKIQESPELILARPDEGVEYHFPQDAGFVLLNPPIH
jgi:Domain of unknown function (DUF4340)